MADETQGTAPDLTQVLIDLQTTLRHNGKPLWERRLWAFIAIIFSGALFWMVHTVNESDKTLAVMSVNFDHLQNTIQEVKLSLAKVVTNVQFGDLHRRVGEVEAEQVRMHIKINRFVIGGDEP